MFARACTLTRVRFIQLFRITKVRDKAHPGADPQEEKSG
jgi:hypothetical protein